MNIFIEIYKSTCAFDKFLYFCVNVRSYLFLNTISAILDACTLQYRIVTQSLDLVKLFRPKC